MALMHGSTVKTRSERVLSKLQQDIKSIFLYKNGLSVSLSCQDLSSHGRNTHWIARVQLLDGSATRQRTLIDVRLMRVNHTRHILVLSPTCGFEKSSEL
jgi:hypothetical protein